MIVKKEIVELYVFVVYLTLHFPLQSRRYLVNELYEFKLIVEVLPCVSYVAVYLVLEVLVQFHVLHDSHDQVLLPLKLLPLPIEAVHNNSKLSKQNGSYSCSTHDEEGSDHSLESVYRDDFTGDKELYGIVEAQHVLVSGGTDVNVCSIPD